MTTRRIILAREDWEATLRLWQCKSLDGKVPLSTAEWWLGPHGYPFVVPVEGEDEQCELWAIQLLCEQFGKQPRHDPAADSS